MAAVNEARLMMTDSGYRSQIFAAQRARGEVRPGAKFVAYTELTTASIMRKIADIFMNCGSNRQNIFDKNRELA